MKKLLFTTSIFLLGIITSFSQNAILSPNNSPNNGYQSRKTHVNPEFCATDQLHNDKMANDPVYRQLHLDMEEKLKKLPIDKNPVNGIYQVPVVVHVMHKGEAVGTGTNISDAEVKAGIQYLNNFWRKVAGSNGDGSGVDMKIEFTLAIQDESGNCSDGIDRVDMSGVPSYVSDGVKRNTAGIDDYNGDAAVNSLKEYSIWDPTEFYNVWIVDEIDNANCYSGGSYTAGYAYYASQHGQAWDGSVVLICSYTDESADTWAHEMGHAFNLPHTFDGDNNGTTCGDDGIADTPSHVRTSKYADYYSIPSIYFDCSSTVANTCDASFNQQINPDNGFTRNSGTAQDHMHNYMDYTGCSNEFTGGQRTVAQAAMTGARGSYLTGYALTPPLPATVAFSAGAAVACQGSSITFTDESSCTPNTYTNTGYTGITFSWTFDNGVNTPYTSTDQNPTITFVNAGTYDVTLQITNPQGTTNLTKSGYISVASAPVASCSPSSNNTGNFSLAVTSVDFNTISNSTGTTNAAYTNYTCSKNTTIDNATAYNLSVDIIGGSGYTEYAEVWIDWDNSGAFESSNANGVDEKVLSGSTPNGTTNTLSASITAPGTATLNTLLRMRVVGEGNSVPSLCGANFVGDCEDYGIYVTVACTNPTITTQPIAQAGCVGDNESFTVASATGTFQWQENTGSGFVNISNGGIYSGATSTTLTLTSITAPMNGYNYRCVVSDGSCVTNSNGVGLTVNEAPSITSQPTNSSITEGNNTSFSVSASNATGYQWQVNTGGGFSNISNGGVYSNATTSTLNITAATLSMNSYLYQCIVTGTCTPNATSNSATLTVTSGCTDPDVPTLSSPPTICNGANTNLSITGNLNDATAWQWYTTSCGGTSVGSGTPFNVSPTTTTTYYVRGEGGCVTPGACASVTVTVNQSPSITSQPTNSSITDGNNTSFNVIASNATGYQWQVNTGGGFTNISNGGVYSNVNTSTLNITAATLSMNSYLYQCVVTGICTPNATSSSATLTVTSGCTNPDVPTLSGTTTICNGSSTTLSINTGNLNDATDWQWYTTSCGGSSAGNGTSINVSPTTTTTYYVRGEGGCVTPGTCTSVTVTIDNNCPVIVSSYCGMNYDAYYQVLNCYPVSGATEYTYEFTPLSAGSTITHISPYSSINLYAANGLVDNTAYNVRIKAKVSGTYGAFGNTCTITTPQNDKYTRIIDPHCNKTYTSYYSALNAMPVTNATEYSFDFAPIGGGASITHVSTYNSLNLYNVSGLLDNTSYNVRVKAKVSGSYGAYSHTCKITTPSAFKNTHVISSHCGKTYTSFANSLNAYPVLSASEYTFKFTPSLGGAPIEFINSSNSILLNYLTAPQLSLSTTYNVQVKAKQSGSYGSYGITCQITTPGTYAKVNSGTSAFTPIDFNDPLKDVKITIYPNPNQGQYLFVELDGLSQKAVIVVSDISGTTVLEQQLNNEEQQYKTTIKFDNKLSPGFYMVTVISNNQKTTKKLIVR